LPANVRLCGGVQIIDSRARHEPAGLRIQRGSVESYDFLLEVLEPAPFDDDFDFESRPDLDLFPDACRDCPRTFEAADSRL
jgi:hypothetical protein